MDKFLYLSFIYFIIPVDNFNKTVDNFVDNLWIKFLFYLFKILILLLFISFFITVIISLWIFYRLFHTG